MDRVEIVLNGESKELGAGTTVAGLIKDLGLVQERLAVEYNLQILKRKHWQDTTLAPGDRVEIVHFVGGGAGRSRLKPSELPTGFDPPAEAVSGGLFPSPISSRT